MKWSCKELLTEFEQDLKVETHKTLSSEMIKILKRDIEWDGKEKEIWCKQY